MLNRGPSIAVPFVGGLDTKSDSKMTPMGRLQVLENGVFTEQGTLKKRWGYDTKLPNSMVGGALGGGVGLTWLYAGTPLAARSPISGISKWNGTLLLSTQKEMFAWSDTAGRWARQSSCPNVSVAVDDVPSVVGEQSMGDSISNGAITAHIWEDSRDSTSVRASIIDSETGFIYVHDYSLDTTGAIPRCGLVGDKIVLVWANPAASTLKSVVITSADPQGSIAATATTFASSMSATDSYDLYTEAGRTWVALMTTELEFHELGTDGDSALSTSRDVATEFTITAANITHLSISNIYGTGGPDGTRTIVAVGCTATGGNGFYVRQYEGSLADSTGVAFSCTTSGTVNNLSVHQVTGESTDGSTPYVVYEIDESGEPWNDKVVWESAGGGVFRTVLHAGVASRGVLIGDSGHIVLSHTSPALQHSYILYDFAMGPVARFAYGAAGASYSKGQLPGLWTSDGVTFGFSALIRRRISTLGQAFEPDNSDAATFENTELGHYTFTLGGSTPYAEVGDSTYFAAGTLMAYSGTKCEESAPLFFPELKASPFTDDTGTYADSLGAGDSFLYRVYYERVRPNGETTRSLAMTYLYTVAGTDATNSITLPTLSHTFSTADGDWRVAVYRTEANKTRLFYQVTSPDLTSSTGVNRYVANESDANTVNLLDTMADSVLIKQKLDPQTQGVLPVIQPAAANIIGEAGDRVYLAGGELPRGVVQPSLLHFPQEPVLFSEALQFSVEEEGGDITAFGAIDGVLVVFKERRIYAMSGAGPDNTGAGGEFNVQRVTTDVGCTQAGSIVETPDGLMFMSEKGLYIISRSFDTEYIGWPVEIFNDQCIVSAEVIPDTNLVVFLASSGNTLAYDYFFKQWTTFTGHAGVDAVVVGGEYHYLRSDGEVYTRNQDAYLDAGSWYALRLRTAPIRMDSVQDYMRVRRLNILGEYLSSHRLQMKVFNNRDIAPFETRIFEPDNVIDITLWGDADTDLWGDADTELWGGTPGDTDYQYQHKFKRQKVQYLRLEFQDLQTGAAPGQSYELAEMNFEIGIYDGNARIPARRKL